MPLPLVSTVGFLPRAVVSSFFFVPTTRNRLIVGEPHDRVRGQALLWERSERAQQVAKPEPVTERLAGYAAPSEYEGTPGHPWEG